MTIQIITVGSGIGAGDPGCKDGPATIRHSKFLNELTLPCNWFAEYEAHDELHGLAAMSKIVEINQAVAKDVQTLCRQNDIFLTLGGDQTCSLGTWSGAAVAHSESQLGLIWFDAHMDAHTPQTSQSKNIHGMPLAALLGHGDPSMTRLASAQVKLHPENVCLIGIRSYEPEEHDLLERLGVTVFDMDAIEQMGLATVISQAKNTVTQEADVFGVTVDMDAIDPREAPGVGTPAENGIHSAELIASMRDLCDDQRFIGGEIVEFNPHHDQEQRTEKILIEIISSMFARIDNDNE